MRKARKTLIHAPTPKMPSKRANPLKVHTKGVAGAKNKAIHEILPTKPSPVKQRGAPKMKSNPSSAISKDANMLKKWMV